MGRKPKQEESTGRVEQLLTLNERAFAMERYVVAHYLLTLALVSAIDLYDLLGLKAVQSRATEQAKWIDTHGLAHPDASNSATEHGDPALFRTLASDARYWQVVVRSAQLTKGPLDTEEGD